MTGWDMLLAGEYFNAVESVFTSIMGNFFYLIIFATIGFVLVIKTEGFGLPLLFLIFTVGLYGHLLPADTAGGVFGIVVAILAGILIYKVFSPAR